MNLRIGLFIIIVICCSVICVSCHKPNPTKAVVIITDTSYKSISGVKVTVYSEANGSYIDPQNHTRNDIQYTDVSGKVYFTFKNKAVFNVKAENFTKQFHRKGDGLLFLEEDRTIEKTIIIK